MCLVKGYESRVWFIFSHVHLYIFSHVYFYMVSHVRFYILSHVYNTFAIFAFCLNHEFCQLKERKKITRKIILSTHYIFFFLKKPLYIISTQSTLFSQSVIKQLTILTNNKEHIHTTIYYNYLKASRSL